MRIGMDTKYLKTVLAYFLSAVCAVVLIFYLCYHLFNGFTPDMQIEPALEASERDRLTLDAYILRDETIVRADYGGTVDYAVSDGERVGVGALLATVYAASDDGDVRRRVLAIDDELEVLEASNIDDGVVVSGTASTDEKINSLLHTIRGHLISGRYDYARRETDSLLVQLNKREIIIGQVQSYSARIASLTAERNNLTARLAGGSKQLYSREPGYFFYGIDGYEGIFSASMLDTLTLDSFAALVETPAAPVPDEAIGKMVDSYVWYVAVPVGRTELDAFTTGEAYTFTFPYNYNLSLDMTLERALTEIGRDDALMIFSCNVMPEDFSYLRVQSVEITTHVQTGLRVPAEAVRVIDGVTGVYIMRGGMVEFRRISILLEREGECIVDATLTAEEGEIPYLALYDEIITAGKELYAGKVLT